MTDTNHISDRLVDLTAEELEIIGYFVRGQKQAITSQNLKLEYTETSIRLSVNVPEDRQSPNFKLLGISKQINQWQRKVLINNNSAYRRIVVETLTEVGFITREKSSHPEFTEHHYYNIPDGYKLNYTEVIQLWRSWWNNKRYQLNSVKPPIDALIFSKGNWHSVLDLQPKQGSFILQTARGQISIDPAEYLVWIDEIEPKMPEPAHSSFAHTPQTLFPNRSGLDSNLSSSVQPVVPLVLPVKEVPLVLPVKEQAVEKIDRRHQYETSELPSAIADPEDEEYVDLESYLNTFNTEDAEDVDRIEGIYNIRELLGGNNPAEDLAPPSPRPNPQPPSLVGVTPEPTPIDSPPVESTPQPKSPVSTPVPPQPPLSLGQQQESLKQKAMNVLANYVRQGDRIVQTEVLKNAQGQEINRKIVNIQRGCPSWAISQIEKLKLGVNNSAALSKQD
jgi:hypothetical protein